MCVLRCTGESFVVEAVIVLVGDAGLGMVRDGFPGDLAEDPVEIGRGVVDDGEDFLVDEGGGFPVEGRVENVALETIEAGTEVEYNYSIDISGKVVAIGGRMLESAARTIINQFFRRLTAQIGGEDGGAPDGAAAGGSFWQWLRRLFGAGK